MTAPPAGSLSTSSPRAFPSARGVALVFLGGAVGTAVRAASLAVFPTDGGWPAGVFVVNAVGSLLLGALVAAIAPGSPGASASAPPVPDSVPTAPPAADRARTDVRLLLGTGVLGGFTTYSAFAADTVSLLTDGQVVVALLYALGSVLTGVVAAAVGLALGGAVGRGGRG